MEKIIEQLAARYGQQIKQILKIDKAELSIFLNKDVDALQFSQKLQDQIVAQIDEFTIYQINIVDAAGKVIDKFATNQ